MLRAGESLSSLAAAPPVLAAHPYAPILVLLLAIVGLVCIIMVVTQVVGPRCHGPHKDATYEAGMATIGDTRRRFSVRFYIVAMLLVLFGVEVLFLWPWAVVFHDVADKDRTLTTTAGDFDAMFLLVSMGVFVGLLVVGFVYEWGKGAFKST